MLPNPYEEAWRIATALMRGSDEPWMEGIEEMPLNPTPKPDDLIQQERD